jgi:hypothetical protein
MGERMWMSISEIENWKNSEKEDETEMLRANSNEKERERERERRESVERNR